MSLYLLRQKEVDRSRGDLNHMIVRAKSEDEALAIATKAEDDIDDEASRQYWTRETATILCIEANGPSEVIVVG